MYVQNILPESVSLFFAENPAWMVYTTLALPLMALLLWVLHNDKKNEIKHSRHARRPEAQPISSYFLNKDRGQDFEFDFHKITLWVNEIENSKEPA